VISWWGKRPTLLGFIVLSSLVAFLALAAALAGFGDSYLPNFLLNAACDMLGGLTVLFLIEPIIRSAAIGIRAHRRMDAGRFCAVVGSARSIVRILDTSSQLIRTDADHGDRLLAAIRSAVARGAGVQVLLMSPSSDVSRARQTQLRDLHPQFDLDQAINQTIAQVRRISRELGPDGICVELRLYYTPVPFILYGADSTLFYTIVPVAAMSGDSPQVEVRAETDIGRAVVQGFEDLWRSARDPEGLTKVRLADQPGAVPMLLRHVEISNEIFLTSDRIDRIFGYQEEPRFLLGDDSGTVYRAMPVPARGTVLHESLLHALADRYPNSARRADRTFYQMVKISQSEGGDGRTLAFRGLPAVHLTSLISVATSELRILDTSSTLLVDDGAPPEQGPAFVAVLDALTHGAKLKVLLMYPGTSFARQRAEEISRPHVESEIEQNLRWLAALREHAARREVPAASIQIKLYNAPPSFSVYQVDEIVIAGFMPVGTRSSGATHYSTQLSSPLAGFVLDQFDLLWSQQPADHVHRLESLEFLTVSAPQMSARILARMWKTGGEWFVSSTRIDDLVEQYGEDLPVEFDRWPGRLWWLPKVLGKVELAHARAAYARRFGAMLEDAKVRQMVPLR
jgi:hypothetical protein